jgi:hypothetical protein
MNPLSGQRVLDRIIRMNARNLYLLLVLAGCHAIANAQLFKCKSAEGRTLFQEVPCAAGTTDMNPRPKPPAPEPSAAVPKRDNKAGANWDLGPRPAVQSYANPVAPPRQPTPVTPPQAAQEQLKRKQADLDRQQAEQGNAEQRKAEEEKAIAFNRMQRCNHARQQLGVVKTERPVYSIDNKGERQYVSDEKRQATIDAAQRRVTEECN